MYGFPLVEQIATFWASRVEWDSKGEYYVINGVQPPGINLKIVSDTLDESAGKVNNSIWTNLIAATSLQFATEAGRLLGIETPSVWTTIANSTVKCCRV
jgi:trehalose/maltose hydrolase-like predicted phosphorylase